jgi:hypothetical protein
MDFLRFQKFLDGEDTTDWKPPVGEGWHPILYAALRKIEARLGALAPSFQITQIKEKFGTLRFYYKLTAPPEIADDVRKIVDEAERTTWNICEECGDVGRTAAWTGAWWTTRCVAHALQQRTKENARLLLYRRWQLAESRNGLSVVDQRGVNMGLDAVVQLARELIDEVISIEAAQPAVPQESTLTKSPRGGVRNQLTELSDLASAYFLSGGTADIDKLIDEIWRAKKGK